MQNELFTNNFTNIKHTPLFTTKTFLQKALLTNGNPQLVIEVVVGFTPMGNIGMTKRSKFCW